MTDPPWDDPARKRYYAIPLELAYEAVLYDIPIDENCCDALRRAIQEKKERLYGSTRYKDQYETSAN